MKKRYKSIVVLSACLSVGAFLAHRVLFFSPGALERYSSYVVYPILVLQHSVVAPIKSYFENRKTIAELEQQLARIQQDRDAVIAQNVELNGMISFAQDVKELVEFKQQYNFDDAHLAEVLVKNFSDQSHYFLIDKGANAGIQKDMAVIYKNALIGKVHEVYPYYSKVLLVSDKSCKVAAYCAQSKATGIYEGCNGYRAASLNHVSHLCQLEVGEMILSSGDGLIFPRGFGLGKIKTFQTDGLFHKVIVEPLIDLRAVNHCYVVQKGELKEQQAA